MWPPEYPANIPSKASLLSKRSYFEHQKHVQAVEVRLGGKERSAICSGERCDHEAQHGCRREGEGGVRSRMCTWGACRPRVCMPPQR